MGQGATYWPQGKWALGSSLESSLHEKVEVACEQTAAPSNVWSKVVNPGDQIFNLSLKESAWGRFKRGFDMMV